MLTFRKPTADLLQKVVAAQRELAFTYTAIGATADGCEMPPGYNVDHTRVELGRGQAIFDRARTALERWEQFRLGWCEPFPTDTPLRTGETVVVVARVCGSWWTNAARIVYTIDDAPPTMARFGFAYGTLPDHLESGEERFLIEWDRSTDQVWYEIRAFSRPRHFLTRLGYPLARAMQKRFGRQSAAAMQAACR